MIVNKITKLYASEGLDEAAIQAHLDEQNALSYYLVSMDNRGGWYRFFWAKEQ